MPVYSDNTKKDAADSRTAAMAAANAIKAFIPLFNTFPPDCINITPIVCNAANKSIQL